MRSAGDDWDPATGVGATATMVAAARARATRAGLLDDRFAQPLVAAVGIDFFTRWATGTLDGADVDAPGSPWGMQAITDRLAARTPFIDAFLTGAADAGVRQAVILASGLDTRGYRLAWPAGMTVFEVDRPQLLRFKRVTLAGLGVQPGVDLRDVAADLRDDWPGALQAAGFDPARPTVWVAEAVLNFLLPAAENRLLDDVTALSAAASRLLVEIQWTAPDSPRILRDATARWHQYGLDLALDSLGYPGPRHDVADYLTGRGWQCARTPLQQLLAAAGLPVPGGSARLDGGEPKLGPPHEPGGSARLDGGEPKLGPPHEPGGSARLDEGEPKLGPPHGPGGSIAADYYCTATLAQHVEQ